MNVAVLDTDIMVYLFENLYNADRVNFNRTVEYFREIFSEMWIPEEVKREFTIRKSLQRRLDKIMVEHGDIISDCPINTSKHERDIFINDIDTGEADAIVQIQKANLMDRHRKRNLIFLSHDKAALRFAEDSGFEVFGYREIKQDLREMGVVF